MEYADYITTAPITLDGGYLLELGVPDSVVGAETMRKLSQHLCSCATATLRVARIRGDADEDMPGTYDHAVAAAELCLQLSSGLLDAAEKTAAREAARLTAKENSNG